jgi:hypothetical protein
MVGRFVVSYSTSFLAYTLRKPRYAPYFVGKAGLPPDHFPKALAVAAVIPNFVGALAGVGFLVGFWMVCNWKQNHRQRNSLKIFFLKCVQGFLVRTPNLPRFWYYWAHWIDYQACPWDFFFFWLNECLTDRSRLLHSVYWCRMTWRAKHLLVLLYPTGPVSAAFRAR